MPTVFPSTALPGSRIAIHGGSPASTLTLTGIILRADAVETFDEGSIVPSGQARWAEPLIADGVTVWIEGYFPSDASGGPVIEERADILSAWDTLRAKLQLASYDLFLHYEPGDEPLYRKYQALTTALIRATWSDPLGLRYQFAAITSNHTISTAAAEEEV